jgi:hypothetical protein
MATQPPIRKKKESLFLQKKNGAYLCFSSNESTIRFLVGRAPESSQFGGKMNFFKKHRARKIFFLISRASVSTEDIDTRQPNSKAANAR